MNLLRIIFILLSGTLSAQEYSTPVNKTLQDKPIPNYPDSNSIYKLPDTNAIYKEPQGFPDTNYKTRTGNNIHVKDSIHIKKPNGRKVGGKHPAKRDKPKILPKKVYKKATHDTTGKGTKQNF